MFEQDSSMEYENMTREELEHMLLHTMIENTLSHLVERGAIEMHTIESDAYGADNLILYINPQADVLTYLFTQGQESVTLTKGMMEKLINILSPSPEQSEEVTDK